MWFSPNYVLKMEMLLKYKYLVDWPKIVNNNYSLWDLIIDFYYYYH